MLSDPLFLLIIFVMLLVVIILFTGIIGFVRGGEFNRKYGNKLMRARIIAQAIAVVLILIFIALRG